jgi:dolichol-phosphate mannosyltransferase
MWCVHVRLPWRSSLVISHFPPRSLTLLLPLAAPSELKLAKIEGEVIIVDDNSRDGSVERVAELQKAGYNVRIIVRTTERGLSSAVLRGFEDAKNDVLVCMDADLQHDPKYLPSLVAPVVSGAADFSVGSRNVDGGEVLDWPLHRRFISWTATQLARPLTSCTDPMSGFFALRRTTLARKRNVNAMGFKIGLELQVRCGCRSIAEVPIVFRDREQGESKLTMKQNIYYLLQLLQLYADAKPQYLVGLAALALTALYVLFKILF